MTVSDPARAVLDVYARQTREPGPVPLSDESLRAVDRVEALPGNRSGADTTWIVRLVRDAMRVRASLTRQR